MTKGIYIGIVAAIGAAAGSIGSVVALSQYWADKPSVSARVIDVSVFEPKYHPEPRYRWAEISLELLSIEQTYPHVTEDKVIRLKATADSFRGDTSEGRGGDDQQDRDNFSNQLSDAIRHYESRRSKVDQLREAIDDIGSELSAEQLARKLDEIESEYAVVTRLSVIELATSIRDRSANDWDEQHVLESLGNLSRTYRGIGDDMDSVVSRLESLRSVLSDSSDDPSKDRDRRRLEVSVVVSNRSRSDNEIVEKALLRMSSEEDGRTADFPIELQSEDGKLDAYSITRLSFQTQPAEKLSKPNRSFIRDLDEENLDPKYLRCRVAIRDLHREPWPSDETQCLGEHDSNEGLQDLVHALDQNDG